MEEARLLERRVAALETAAAVISSQSANVSERLKSIEDTLRWLVRLIIGALIMAIVAFAIKGGFHV